MIKATYAGGKTAKSLKESSHGKLGVITKGLAGNSQREGQLFLTGAFSIMFLWDGGIQDKDDKLYEVRWLESGEKVTLIQE